MSDKNLCWMWASGLSNFNGKRFNHNLKTGLGSNSAPCVLITFPIEAIALSLQCPYAFSFSVPLGIFDDSKRTFNICYKIGLNAYEGVLSENIPRP
jgi:hypothetical protein